MDDRLASGANRGFARYDAAMQSIRSDLRNDSKAKVVGQFEN